MNNKTLLVIAPGQDVKRDAVFKIFVAETGEHLASHLCSCAGFAYGDLYAHRPERIEKWTNRFGELEVKYIDQTDISKEQLLERNKKWYANIPKEQKTE
jgi:hypothetical protein